MRKNVNHQEKAFYVLKITHMRVELSIKQNFFSANSVLDH